MTDKSMNLTDKKRMLNVADEEGHFTLARFSARVSWNLSSL